LQRTCHTEESRGSGPRQQGRRVTWPRRGGSMTNPASCTASQTYALEIRAETNTDTSVPLELGLLLPLRRRQYASSQAVVLEPTGATAKRHSAPANRGPSVRARPDLRAQVALARLRRQLTTSFPCMKGWMLQW
jgi:hypothetical protein